MQKKGIWLPIYAAFSNGLGVQKLHNFFEDLAQKIWEVNTSKISDIIDYILALVD